MKRLAQAAIAALLLTACASTPEPQWVSIFNGRDLSGWTPKFTHHPLGENVNDTFRVEQGMLVVSYDRWTAFGGQFGHLFYETPYSHYRIRLEYRFVGEQVPGGPEWAVRNNGIMVHSQPPETMTLDQNFPNSVEAQLLGRDGVAPRTTANLCTPGISVLLNGERAGGGHCYNSDQQGPAPGEWASVEMEVQGSQVIRHIVNGRVVMEYSEPQVDNVSPWSPTRVLSSGYIALQAESHGTEIRNIELMALD
jgi:hypothetical protein